MSAAFGRKDLAAWSIALALQVFNNADHHSFETLIRKNCVMVTCLSRGRYPRFNSKAVLSVGHLAEAVRGTPTSHWLNSRSLKIRKYLRLRVNVGQFSIPCQKAPCDFLSLAPILS